MKKYLFSIIVIVLTNSYTFSQKRYVTVNNTKYWVNTIGLDDRKDNQPVIIFENGSGESMESWDKIIDVVSKKAPVFTYDRAGLGNSDPTKDKPSLKYNSDRLKSILLTIGIQPPYILVGHSIGSFYIGGFAKYYPNDLAGMIYVDPDDFTQTLEDFKNPFREVGMNDKYIDSMMNKKVASAFNIDSANATARDKEYKMIWELRLSNFSELKNFQLPQVPTYFLVGGRFSVPVEQRSKDYNQELLFRTRTKHWIENWTNYVNQFQYGRLFYSTKAGHYLQYDDPNLVTSSIELILQDYKEMMNNKK